MERASHLRVTAATYDTAGPTVRRRRTPPPRSHEVLEERGSQAVGQAGRGLASFPILTFPEVTALEFELIRRVDQPPLGAGEAVSTPLEPPRSATRCSTPHRCAAGSVPFRAERVKAALTGL
jgi:hypothetical protein